MIRYALTCGKAHAFESWFRSSDDFDAQLRRDLVNCPVCGSSKIEKQIMAPSIARTERNIGTQSAPLTEMPDTPQPVALVGEREKAMRTAIRALREQLIANSEDVGKAFPEEARKIHYGESAPRPIRGEASADVIKALVDEGVDCHPLPSLPDERN